MQKHICLRSLLLKIELSILELRTPLMSKRIVITASMNYPMKKKREITVLEPQAKV